MGFNITPNPFKISTARLAGVDSVADSHSDFQNTL